jgi:MFS family permease
MATAARKRTAGNALILLLGAAVFLNYVDRGAVGIAAPLMQSDLKLSATAFGLVASAFFWVYGPVQLVVGWMVDRFSVYRLMAAGLLVWAVSTLLMGFAGGFLSLLVLRVMLGIGESIAFPGTSKIIAEQVPAQRRGMANAVVSLGIALGPAAGTLAGGLILASWGWRAIFIVFGMLTLLWLWPWREATRGLEPASRTQTSTVPMVQILKRWPLWSMSIAHIASNYGFYFLLIWLPVYLVRSRGLPIGEMTLLATLGYAAQAAAAVVFGMWSDRWTI